MNSFNIEEVLKSMTLEEKAQMCSGRDFWFSQNIDRLGIPSVMMCDGPNGLRKQLGEGDHLGINESIETVCYPTASAMAASFDRELLQRLGELLGEECQAEQVGMLLGPGVNMKRSPLCGRNFEYFSEDPYLAGQLAASYIQGLQSRGVAACVKHFAANNQETCRMSGSSQVDERTFHEIYLPAFEAAVKEGKVRSVMCAYNAVNGTFCAENAQLIQETLRKQWGFDGLVVTDWGAVKDRVKGLWAGIDLEMPGSTTGKQEAVVAAAEDGSLPMEILDAAVRNNLRFVRDVLENRKEDASFDREGAHAASADFAAECAVLLKNEQVLPLKENQKVVFIGEFAEKPRFQGAGSSHINVRHPLAAMECVDGRNVSYVQGYASEGGVDAENIARAVQAARDAETAVIFAGLPESCEIEGRDRVSMKLPENQNALIAAVAAVQKRTVVVLHTGAAVELPWRDQAAILCMYLAGDGVGKAAVDLLYGRRNPSGKLAESWPVKLSDNPSYLNFPGEGGVAEYREGIFIGYRYYDKKEMEVLYPFGHGLSYTEFVYSDLSVSSTKLTEHDMLTVSCKVKNTGTAAGAEVVQLYVGAGKSAVRRPIRELRGFEKLVLLPGEEKTVAFTLGQRAFSYYETRIHDWFVESGSYCVEVGASSRDIRLEAEVSMKSGMSLPMHFTRTSTVADLQKNAKGRVLFEQIASMAGSSSQDNAHLGAGSGQMMDSILEMPLGALVSYGRMSDEELETLIAEMNR